jgi:hypothetical protein
MPILKKCEKGDTAGKAQLYLLQGSKTNEVLLYHLGGCNTSPWRVFERFYWTAVFVQTTGSIQDKIGGRNGHVTLNGAYGWLFVHSIRTLHIGLNCGISTVTGKL